MQTFFHFDPKIMIQMNSPEHGQEVGCGDEDDEQPATGQKAEEENANRNRQKNIVI